MGNCCSIAIKNFRMCCCMKRINFRVVSPLHMMPPAHCWLFSQYQCVPTCFIPYIMLKSFFLLLLQSQLLLCNLKCETQYKALNIFMVFLSESNNAGILKYYICPLGVHLGNTLRQLFSAVQVLVPIHLYWERLVYQKQNFHKIIRFCC